MSHLQVPSTTSGAGHGTWGGCICPTLLCNHLRSGHRDQSNGSRLPKLSCTDEGTQHVGREDNQRNFMPTGGSVAQSYLAHPTAAACHLQGQQLLIAHLPSSCSLSQTHALAWPAAPHACHCKIGYIIVPACRGDIRYSCACTCSAAAHQPAA